MSNKTWQQARGPWLAALTCLATGGCSTGPMRVTAYRSGRTAFPPPGRQSAIGVVTATAVDEPLLHTEVADKVAYLLQQRGYRVTNPQDARYLLSCWFDIDTGQTVAGATPMHEPGTFVSVGVGGRRWRSRMVYVPGRTYYVPYEYTLFGKYLELTLYDQKRARELGIDIEAYLAPPAQQHEQNATSQTTPQTDTPPREQTQPVADAIVWRCTAVNADTSTDLRWRVNHLLLTCFDYFGLDSGKEKKKTMFSNDDRAKELAEATTAPTP